ncbi:MAG: sulfatase-like hydrolase/transferase, partial [Anaerolineae bacterium]|nr:sulfatase-like hydrolase/transferase [Anaerolineae bacterium]
RLENFGFDAYEVEAYHQLQGLVEWDDLPVQRAVRQPGYKDFLLYGVNDQPVEETPEYQLYSQGIDFLRNAARDPDRPWALFISSEAPHDPYVVPRSYYQRYDPASLPRPASFDDPLADRPAIYRRIQRVWQDLDWDDYARATACYYALCTLIDDQIGRVLAVLEELDQLDNTIIVFTSDHGDYMGAHRLMLKGVPAFEEVYRVPVIMAGPGVLMSNQIDNLTSLIDIGPTLVELLTVGRFDCQGRSFAPLLRSDAAEWTDEAYAEMQGQRFAYQQRVLWRDQWKYVFNTFDEDELYDLAADPHELSNLAGEPDCRSVLERMAGRMWQIISETDDWNMRQAQYGMFRFAPVGPEAARP